MRKNIIKQYILEDFYRYYGEETNKKTYLRYAYTYPNIAFTRNLRLAKYYKNKNKIKYIWYKLRHRKLFYKYSFQIPFETTIGRGFYLAHFGNIIINHPPLYNLNFLLFCYFLNKLYQLFFTLIQVFHFYLYHISLQSLKY